MILSSVSFVVFVDSFPRQHWCFSFSPLEICGIYEAINIAPSLFSLTTKGLYGAKGIYSILTLHMLPSQTVILEGETIPLDQVVHVWFQMNNYGREYLC